MAAPIPVPDAPALPPSPPAPTAPTATLTLDRAPSAVLCPDQNVLAELVMKRLGRDPFVAHASRVVRVRFAHVHGDYRAEITIRDGARRGTRVLTDRACGPLAESVALALAIAIDPLRAYAADGPRNPAWRGPESMAERVGRRDVPEPAPPLRPRPPRTRSPAWGLAPTMALAVGAAPGALIGPGLRLELSGRHWRVALDMALLYAPPAAVGFTEVSVVRLEAHAIGCWRAAEFSLCGRLGAAHWIASADQGLIQPITAAREAASVGVQAGLGFTRLLALELALDLSLTARPTFLIDAGVGWRGWPVAPRLTLVVRP